MTHVALLEAVPLRRRRYLGKPGGGPGFCSNLRIHPNERLASVWSGNTLSFSERRIEYLSDQLDGALLPEPRPDTDPAAR